MRWQYEDPNPLVSMTNYSDPNVLEDLVSSLFDLDDFKEYDRIFNYEFPQKEHCLGLRDSKNQAQTIPLPSCVPTYEVDWTYKKGKRKRQQYWVYCEESQTNYASFSLVLNGTPLSEGYTVKKTDRFLVFLEEPTEGFLAKGIYVDLSQPTSFLEGEFDITTLEDISFDEIDFRIDVIEDKQLPVHPHQGPSNSIKTTTEIAPGKAPFTYFAKLSFKNRSEGWFRLAGSLSYRGITVTSSLSSPFMLNNPRMKKRKEFLEYASEQVKFMQVYSLSENKSALYWLELGKTLGYSDILTRELLQNAENFFSCAPTPCLGKRKVAKSSSPSAKKRKSS